MATPHTWTVDEVTRPGGMTAAKFNTYIRDDLQNLQDQIVVTSGITPTAWTPAVDQNGPITITVIKALYVVVNQQVCVYWFNLTTLSAGTAGSRITMSLPIDIAVAQGLNDVVGLGFYDVPASWRYHCVLGVEAESPSTVYLSVSAGVTGLFGQTLISTPSTSAFAIASGHHLRGFGSYLVDPP